MLPRPNRHRSAAELLPPAPPAPAPSLTRAAPGAVSRCCPRTPGCSWCCGAGHHSLPGAWLFLGLILLSCGCSLSCSGSASLELGWWQQEGLGGVCGQEAGAVCGGLCVCLSVRLSVRVCPCRHGQLGHGQLEAELQPRLVEALAGVPMRAVAAGGWHSASVSEAGDLYMWGWNESGQLALPSKALAEERARDEDKGAGSTKLMPCQEQLAAQDAAFISIQAFPALLDLPQDLEVSAVSCGSRHTAAVTRGGELYTWGWGKWHPCFGTAQPPREQLLVPVLSPLALLSLSEFCLHWGLLCSLPPSPQTPGAIALWGPRATLCHDCFCSQ
ncbi:RCC1 domain-containing protein 1 isoform X4 [Melospiza georgiana]|uniref:RCC1 domain-containing protein 1 isoform X4 n=1 Tax=Melospiza georgiana TaxID=44398 RepID=UPI0025ACD65B|nr:RCC1 domain-containing protein 1 isoform X4 [Melospiza georgiana]